MMEIYVNPENEYQHFLNAFARKNPYGPQQQIVRAANELWKTIKGDKEKVSEYINFGHVYSHKLCGGLVCIKPN